MSATRRLITLGPSIRDGARKLFMFAYLQRHEAHQGQDARAEMRPLLGFRVWSVDRHPKNNG